MLAEGSGEEREPSGSRKERSKYMLVLSRPVHEEVVEYVRERLESRGLVCQRVDTKEYNSIIVSAPFNVLARQVGQS